MTLDQPVTPFRLSADFVLKFGDYPGVAIDDIATTDVGLKYLDKLYHRLMRHARRGRVHGHRQVAYGHLKTYLSDGLIARDLAKLVTRDVDTDLIPDPGARH